MAGPALQMLTANRLVDGDVVYWRAGGWVQAFAEGEVLSTGAEDALAAARDFVSGNVVVNPYLFEVREDAGRIYPVKEREIIRAAGPTVRSDLGKQAKEFAPPLWGGRRAEQREAIRVGGGVDCGPPPGSLRSPTSPQGGGGEDDVSI